MTTVECLGCRRTYQKDGQEGVSHGWCAQCYAVKPESNGGLDWRTLSPAEREELKQDIRNQVLAKIEWQGEPQIKFSEDEEKFYEEIKTEILKENSESEFKGGGRK